MAHPWHTAAQGEGGSLRLMLSTLASHAADSVVTRDLCACTSSMSAGHPWHTVAVCLGFQIRYEESTGLAGVRRSHYRDRGGKRNVFHEDTGHSQAWLPRLGGRWCEAGVAQSHRPQDSAEQRVNVIVGTGCIVALRHVRCVLLQGELCGCHVNKLVYVCGVAV